VPGAEKALLSFIDILRKWISVERWFCDSPSYADSVDSVRKLHMEDSAAVLNICRAHEQLKTTSYIITLLMSAIDDGARVDLTTSNTAAIAKRVSVVAGAESLPNAFPSISEVGMLGQNKAYAEVALRARKLLMQDSMPSLEQRKKRLLEAARQLTESKTQEADDLLADQTPVLDVFFPLLKKVLSTKEEVGLLELIAKRLYRTYTVNETERNYDCRLLKFSFTNKASERVLHKMTSVRSMTELGSLVSSSSLSKLDDSSDSDAETKLLTAENQDKIPSNVIRTGIFKILESIEDVSSASSFESVLKNFPQFTDGAERAEIGPVNVLYLIVPGTMGDNSDEASSDALAKRCQAILAPYKDDLAKAKVRRVTFNFDRRAEDGFEGSSPVTFTYRCPEFAEDSLIRSIDPSHAIHLDLARVAANFRVRTIGARHTSASHIHLYEGTPKSSALVKDKKANKSPRMFVRALSFNLDFSSSSFERILVDALNALDLCSENLKSDNHLLVNLVSDFEKVVLDPVVVEQVVVDILKRHGDRVSALGIVEVETKILCSLSRDSSPLSLRLVASNPTGFVHVMNTYVEAADETGPERVFKLIGGTKASLACAGDSSWEGLNVNTPYPLTRPFDHQRRAALRSSDTLYCYDLPALFEAAVEQEWAEASKKGGVEGDIRAASRPLMVMYTTELVVKKAAAANPDDWTMEDYSNGDLELVQVNRGAGANNVGMTAWLMVLKTVEYPNVSLLSSLRVFPSLLLNILFSYFYFYRDGK
jgi:acetyl-CoA carboxylase/biotin carboxylase 1